MSIINQMLKDLDDRRGPVFGAQLAALQGMGLVNTGRIQWQHGLELAGRGLVAVFTVIIGYQSTTWWLSREHIPSSSEYTQPVIYPDIPERAATQNIATATILQQHPASATTSPSPVASPDTDTPEVTQTLSIRKVVPVTALTPAQQADNLFARAQTALVDGRKASGEQLLREALQALPSHGNARTQLAALLISWQRPDDAERLLAEGLSGNPRNLELAIPYAQLLAARNAPDAALEILDSATAWNHASAEAFSLRAALLYRLGRHPESISAYRSALQLQPQHALWWTGLAVALEHDRQPAQALHAYRRAATLPLEQAVTAYVQQRIRLLRRGPSQD